MKNSKHSNVYTAMVRPVSVFALAAALGATLACSGGSNSPADPSPTGGFSPTEGGGSELAPLGTFSGVMRDGHLTLSPVTPASKGKPGLSAQGFGEFLSGTMYFETTGDGIGTGSCSSTQYCADVTAENGNDATMDNVFVEITNYTGVQPAGAAVSWGGPPFPLSATYSDFFVNSSNIEAAQYDSIDPAEVKPVEWKFNLDAGSPEATGFTFSLKVYASFRRTNPVSQQFQRVQTPIDACGGVPGYFNGGDDAEASVALPFPYTLGDITYDNAVIGSNGYLLFYQTGGSVPTRANSGLNAAITAAVPIGYYPFWDDLAFDSGNGVCTTTTGTKPDRLFTITWHEAKIYSAQPTKGTPAAQRVTYSLVLEETTDSAIFAYNLPTGGFTNTTRGLTATIGERAIRNGASAVSQSSFNAANVRIPAVTGDYAARIFRQQSPVNPG